jgi:predicted HNH restriction endonuclease
VPVALIEDFETRRKTERGFKRQCIGPTQDDIDRWFREYAVDLATALAPDPADELGAEGEAPPNVDAGQADSDASRLYPDEYFEGEGTPVLLNAYERDPNARAACIAHYGARCQVCGLDFATRYGSRGEGFIHVHHLATLASGEGRTRQVDPVRDLRPVCPNCHVMLHRVDPPSTIEELRGVLALQVARAPR